MRCLRRLGVEKEKARQVTNTRKGCWHATDLPLINWAIDNKKLAAAGCYDIEAAYQRVYQKSLKPPIT